MATYKEITTRSVPHTAEPTWRAAHIFYVILGALEAVLGMRFVFKLLGANPSNGFVSGLYNLSDWLIAPFSGIFHRTVTSGIETRSVFEPETLIAMLVYGLVFWAIIRLLRPSYTEEV